MQDEREYDHHAIKQRFVALRSSAVELPVNGLGANLTAGGTLLWPTRPFEILRSRELLTRLQSVPAPEPGQQGKAEHTVEQVQPIPRRCERGAGVGTLYLAVSKEQDEAASCTRSVGGPLVKCEGIRHAS